MANNFSNIATHITDLCAPSGLNIVVIKLTIIYLIGSIPFGAILTRLGGYGDIRKIGSGNTGATNVLRTGNKFLAFCTLVLDAGKAAFTIWLLKPSGVVSDQCYSPEGLMAEALGITFLVMIGHCFPLWLKFKGGKGVATGLGGLLAGAPYIGLCACAAWLATVKITKTSSLSALVAFAVAPLAGFFIYGDSVATSCLFITALVFWRHDENIMRLLSGTEPKIGQKETDAANKI